MFGVGNPEISVYGGSTRFLMHQIPYEPLIACPHAAGHEVLGGFVG